LQATLEQVSDACFVLDDQDQFSRHGLIKHRSFFWNGFRLSSIQGLARATI
jgi:hypothetical protein